MEATVNNDFLTSSARRLAFWGPAIAGFLGLILTVNASLDGEFIGAGACLIASVFAFGVIGYTFSRN